ncbi:MAG: hypothetical protein DHS20C11_01170 [Lysobacteraceae bacterium]|nr:MAG: hypothetical protein DHS20C11_01170 [Xanthomonadaceae bacterium]
MKGIVNIFLAAALAGVGVATDASDGAENAASLYGELSILEDYADPTLRSGHDLFRPLTDAMAGYFDFKDRLSDKQGLAYTIEIAPQFQWGLDGGYTANNETNLILQWAAVDTTDSKRGSLLAWYQFANTLSDLNTSQFMDRIGVISPVNGGDTAPGSANQLWQMLAWEQWFADEALRFGVGKLTTRTFLNLNRYAVSDREDFFSPMIVNNPVSPFTARNGMGAFGQYHFDTSYLTTMLREADGTSTDISFDSIGSGKWEGAVELGLTPQVAGLGQGYYRFTAYYTDDIGAGVDLQPHGWSAALSFDQDFGDKYAGLVRYAWASERYRAFKQRIAIGAQIKAPLQFENDRIGVAAWWAESSAAQLGNETGLELFWKLQLAPYLEFTPDLQVIFNPQQDTTRDVVYVANLRLRVVL